jgi:hypothetical protein
MPGTTKKVEADENALGAEARYVLLRLIWNGETTTAISQDALGMWREDGSILAQTFL